MTKNAQRATSILSLFILPLATLGITFVLPGSAWRFAPLVGISAAIVSEWIVLLSALLIRTMRPAIIARAAIKSNETPEVEQLKETSGDQTRTNSGELLLPEVNSSSRVAVSAISQVGAWIYRGLAQAKHMVTYKQSDENIDKLLFRLSETEQGRRLVS